MKQEGESGNTALHRDLRSVMQGRDGGIGRGRYYQAQLEHQELPADTRPLMV